MKKSDECLSQIRDSETEDLIESYKSFFDEMHEKGFDLENILSFDDYKKFLSSGSSTDPISLLKIAGVDMTTAKPINDALELFNELIDELAELAE